MRGAYGHQGLVLRRSCKFRMNLALNMSPPTVQDWAGGAWACGGTVCMGTSPDPSCDKTCFSLADLVGGREMESGYMGTHVGIKITLFKVCLALT